MSEPDPNPNAQNAWLESGGQMAALVRSLDWSKTALGPIPSWPASLKTTVGTLLHSRHPMFLWWGSELTQIYNDAYVPSFGRGKHPAALGQRGKDCWQEIWPIIWPQIEDVMLHAKASWNEDQLVPVWRNERLEEVYWTYGYSPVFVESGAVGGTLVVCTETTTRVLAERRLGALRWLAEKTAIATTIDEVLAAAAELFATTPNDTPFAMIYARDATDALVPKHCVGLNDAQRDAVDAVCGRTHDTSRKQARIDLKQVTQTMPGGPWPEPADAAFVAPIRGGDGAEVGFLVFGLSPRLSFDSAYSAHLVQLIDHLSLAVVRIEMYRAKEATSLERNNLLLQAPMPTALFRGPTHVFELANPLYCQMVGRSGLVGKSYREAFPELVDTALPGVLDDVYRNGKPFSSGEMLVSLDKRGDGTLEECFFTFNLEPLRDANGVVYGMMAVALEITEQVNARRSVERSQTERGRLVSELEQANRTKDEFFAMLGHELRNPLAPIRTALHLMKERDDGKLRREQEIIERQVSHLVRLVDDLLDVSRIARGKVTLKTELVEIGTVVADAVEMTSDLLEQHRHQLSIELPLDGARVDGDPVRLAQVIANLLTNAARYTEPGGKISLVVSLKDGELRLIVKDNGIGIDAELLPRVFDLFVQGRRTTDRKEGGLGLGLALVQSFVTMHGGSVTARSEGLGHGSEFEIRLPTSAKTIDTDAADRKAPASSTRSKRVLIVDDNVDSAEMMMTILQSVGHEIAIAHDGPEALAVIENFSPEIALLDIGLPVMDGYELGRRLHATKQAASCRLIALTGYGQEHDRAQSKAAGFAAHLVKPVDMKNLLLLIAETP